MVACALLDEGYGEHAVGIILGVDHSTVHHYRDRMDTIKTAPGYDLERKIWARFRELVLLEREEYKKNSLMAAETAEIK